MSYGQNVLPSSLMKFTIGASSISVASSVYINTGTVDNVMASLAYDSTNGVIYVIYFNPTYSTDTPVIL